MEWFLIPLLVCSAIGCAIGFVAGVMLEKGAGTVIVTSLGGAWVGLLFGIIPALVIFVLSLALVAA